MENRMMKRLSIFVALALALALPLHGGAQTFVAPSSSPVVVLLSGAALANGTILTSSAYGTTGFENIQIRLEVSNPRCTQDPNVIILGSSTATGTFTEISDDHSGVTFITTVATNTYLVGNLTKFIKITISGSATSTGSACTINAYMTPMAFTQKNQVVGSYKYDDSGFQAVDSFPVMVGAVSVSGTPLLLNEDASGNLRVTTTSGSRDVTTPATSPVSVSSSAGGTLVLTTTSTFTGFNLQNAGTVVLYCATDSLPSSTHYSVALAASAVANDGTGGAWTEENSNADTIYCRAASGTGSVAVTLK